jgi:hypothetical protein
MRKLHGFEKQTVGLSELEMLQASDFSGTRFSRPVMRWALETVGKSDRAAIGDLIGARLEIMQVFLDGTNRLSVELGIDENILRKIRHRNYAPLSNNILKKIDELWDRIYVWMRHAQI